MLDVLDSMRVLVSKELGPFIPGTSCLKVVQCFSTSIMLISIFKAVRSVKVYNGKPTFTEDEYGAVSHEAYQIASAGV